MKLADLLKVIDYEQKMKVCIEKNATIEAELSGDQMSMVKMLSAQILESDVSCIAARDDDTLYVWLEDVKDEN